MGFAQMCICAFVQESNLNPLDLAALDMAGSTVIHTRRLRLAMACEVLRRVECATTFQVGRDSRASH